MADNNESSIAPFILLFAMLSALLLTVNDHLWRSELAYAVSLFFAILIYIVALEYIFFTNKPNGSKKNVSFLMALITTALCAIIIADDSVMSVADGRVDTSFLRVIFRTISGFMIVIFAPLVFIINRAKNNFRIQH